MESLAVVRSQLPEVEISEAAFGRGLQVLPADASPETLLELGLVVACVAGDRRAMQWFETRYFGDATRAVTALLGDPDAVEDILQSLRHRLFVAKDDEHAQIVRSVGRGSLAKFVRVCAVRLALNSIRSTRRRCARNLGAADPLLGALDDPETSLARSSSSKAVKVAFERAIAALSPKQRNLLRHQLIDHLTLDQLAARYGVHRRTAARWLASARAEVARRTREQLAARLGDAAEANLKQLVHSRIDLSLTRVLGQSSAQIPVST
ncbi:MAG: sigma-70 family RNA polymerase sigma factor [Nannocystaceae bacterium]|nr:RNA polymerase sigma factor [bacterium]